MHTTPCRSWDLPFVNLQSNINSVSPVVELTIEKVLSVCADNEMLAETYSNCFADGSNVVE